MKGEVILKRIIPETFEDYQFISGPLLSPDGKVTAFIVQTMDMENNKYTGRLCTVDNQNGTVKTVSERDIKRFVWTPGGKLLYSVPAGGKEDLKMEYRCIDWKTGEEETAAVPVSYTHLTLPTKA